MGKDTVDDAKAEEIGGDSSNPDLDPEHFSDDRDNLIDTVEIDENVGGIDLSTGGARKTESSDKGEPDDKGKSEKDEKLETDKTDKVEDEKAEPYHKDPAWQRIIKERDQYKAENEELRSSQTPDDEQAKDFIDLSTKTEEEIAEWMNDDPAGFAENQRKQIAYEIKQDMKAENEKKETQSKLDRTFSEYSSKHPDNEDKTGFVQMWESGKLQDFMENNPGHTAISAHMVLTEETRSKSVEEQINSAVSKEVEKIKKKLLAENRARVKTDGLDTGPSYTPGDKDDELKDTKSKGGLVTVLASRLARRNRQAG